MSWDGVGEGASYGLFIQNRKDGYDYPAGLAVCCETEDRLIVMWLCISPQYKGKGYGENLLWHIFNIAHRKGKSYIGAYFNEMVNRRYICFDDRHYFAEHGFEHERKLGGEWLFDIRAMLQCDEWRTISRTIESKENAYHISSFAELDGRLSAFLLTQIRDYPKAEGVLGMKVSIEKIDADISFVVIEDNAFAGSVLFQSLNDRILPVLFYAVNSEIEDILLYKASEAIEEKYGSRQIINAVVTDAKNRNMLERFVPEYVVYNSIMTADINIVNSRRISDIADFFETEEYMSERGPAAETSDIKDCLIQGRDTSVTVNMLSKALSAGNTISDDIYSFGELNFTEQQKIVFECRNLDNKGILKEIPYAFDALMFDYDVSCCLLRDGIMKGILLVGILDEKKLIPVLFFSDKGENKTLGMNLMKYSVNQALELYGGDAEFILRAHDDFSSALIGRLSELAKK